MIGLISTLFTGGMNIFKSRQQIKAKKQERSDRIEEVKTQAKIKRIEQGDNNAAKLDELSIADRGWKDEYLLILTTAPLFLAFIPDFAQYVKMGFDALNTSVPEYYWYALAMIYIDTFGFRRMLRVAVEHWLNKKFGGGNGVS
ncbi:hypothetical protein [Aliivibrio kagoshimensis]|uniref:hypothetical protein n=1 Tax=Aliivibrio kagoshimensis TaxID=2910230 RepID=UPI003D0DCA1E